MGVCGHRVGLGGQCIICGLTAEQMAAEQEARASRQDQTIAETVKRAVREALAVQKGD